MSAFEHGTLNAYNYHRCRCDDCRKNWNAHIRRRNWDRYRGNCPDHLHGTRNGYVNYMCRCDACSAVQKAEMRAYRARLKAS